MSELPDGVELSRMPLPSNWAWTTIGDLRPEFQNGESSRGQAGGVPTVVLRLADIADGTISLGEPRWVPLHDTSSRKYRLRRGDILVIRVNGSAQLVGQFVFADVDDVVYCDHFIRMRVSDELADPRYLTLLASSSLVRRQVEGTFVSTAGQKTVNQRHIQSIAIPLAPRREQERIVAAIEEQFSRVDAGVAALDRIRQNLKRMRAAVLHAAVTGRLTDPHLVGADHKLPLDWRYVSVGDIAEVSGGITKNPKRRPNKNPVPFLRVANVPRDGLTLDDVHQIEVFDGELERMRLRAGDLLVVEGNGSPDQIGRSALWHGEIDPCVHQNHLIRVRSNDRVLPEYLNLYWNAPSSMATIQAAASSTSGLHTLSTGKVRSIPVVLPPVDAQARIVDEVKRQLSFIDVLEVELHATIRRSYSLRSSLLTDAFSGKLVVHDPTEEPASVMLERIAAELPVSNSQRSTGRKSRMKVTA